MFRDMLLWISETLFYLTGGENAFGTVVRGESSITGDREYYVPKDCYATDLDSWNGPTLYGR